MELAGGGSGTGRMRALLGSPWGRESSRSTAIGSVVNGTKDCRCWVAAGTRAPTAVDDRVSTIVMYPVDTLGVGIGIMGVTV